MNKNHLLPGRAARALTTGIASLLLAGASSLTGAATASAQDSGALVDALVRKGVLTNQEAEDVRADLTRDLAQTSAGKIKLSNSVTELKLYGDLRLRYQYENREAQVPDTGHNFQQDRYRFRLRINAEAKLGREWFAGFSLGTGQPSDSEEQTFENGFDDYNIFITRAYLGWQPNDWLTVVAGKQKNPFYTTDLVWDADITPTGVTEVIALHNLPIFGGSGGPSGDAKDIKTVADPKRSNPWEFNLIAGQFIFDDNSEFNVDSDLNTDAWLFVEQLVTTYKFNKDTSITVAPGFMTYTAADLSGLTNSAAFTDAAFIGSTTSTRTTTSTVLTTTDVTSAAGVTTRTVQPTTVTTVATTVTNPDGTQTVTTNAATNRGPAAGGVSLGNIGRVPGSQTTSVATLASAGTATPATPINGLSAVSGETRQMHLITAPGDISFKLGGIKSKLYWDFAYNFGGRQRFEDIYQLFNESTNQYRYTERDGTAWLAGIQFGELKKKGDWQINANYREVGIASVDPNLNDSTWALSRLNQRGFKLGLAYQIAEPVVFSVTGYLSWNLNGDISGGRATNAPNIADSNAVQVLQVDLAVKF